MSDDTITYTPTEENPWYKLAIIRIADKPSNHIWNGYMRHLMKSEGKSAEADKVKVIRLDGKDCNLPELTPGELTIVQSINGLPGKLDEISFEGCSFDNGANFISFYFPTLVSFKNANLGGWADFKNASFGGDADFSRASFLGLLQFRNVSFGGKADFNNASFVCPADFKNASFAGMAHFTDAKFAGLTDFSKASFAGVTDFRNASFAIFTDFNNASFAGFAGFTDASFADRAEFNNTSFAGFANFSKAKFKGEANFSASPDTPPHKGSVSFAGATFTQAPAFFERQLHEDTDWQGVKWPEPPNKEQASDDVRRYERLSLMMSRLEKYDDMHTFFRLSMQAKEIRDGRWSVASVMSRIYGALYDYGWGVGRAFGLWAGHIVLGFLLILGLISINGQLQAEDVVQSLALSFSNAHSFIGLHSGAQANLYAAAGAIPWFNVIWVLQTVIGLPLLFFLLLTIRNRFRMR